MQTANANNTRPEDDRANLMREDTPRLIHYLATAKGNFTSAAPPGAPSDGVIAPEFISKLNYI